MFAILKYLILLFILRWLRTYLYGIHTEMAVTYTDTYYIITAVSQTANGTFILFQLAYLTQKYTTSRTGFLRHGSSSPRVHKQLI